MKKYNEHSRVPAIFTGIILPIISVGVEWLWLTYLAGLVDVSVRHLLLMVVLSLFLFILFIVLLRYILPPFHRQKMLQISSLWVILYVMINAGLSIYIFDLSVGLVIAYYSPVGSESRFIILLLIVFLPIVFVRIPKADPDLFSLPVGRMATVGLLPSWLKVAYYRRRGARIGDGVSIGYLSVLDCPEIEISNNAKIGTGCFIRAKEFKLGKYSELGRMVIIDTHKVTIGDESKVLEQTYIGGLKTEESSVEIGDLTMVFPQCVINPTYPIKIGSRVCIGGSTYLFTHGTWQPILDGFPATFGPITIDDGAWVAWRTFVLPNIRIGKQATIGAGALVNRDVPDRCLAAGVPATIRRKDAEYIKKYTESEKQEILRRLFGDLVTYLRAEGWSVDDPIRKDCYTKTCFRTPIGPSSRRDNHLLFLFEDSDELWDRIDDTTYLVSLVAIDAGKANGLEKKGCWWYDLENGTWGGTRTNVSLVINGFMSRYGHWLKYAPMS